MPRSFFRSSQTTHTLALSTGSTRVAIRLRSVRPSLVDWRFKGDACIEEQETGTLVLRLGDYILTQFPGLSLDLPSLNRTLDQLWNSRSRKRPS